MSLVQPKTAAPTHTSHTSIQNLVSYTLPAGWTQSTCPSSDIIFISPDGATADCHAEVPALIQISHDAQNTTDCNQLQPTTNQGIRDHTCLSTNINGHKSLRSLTEYSADTTYGVDTTFSDYYYDTAQGVVKLEYTYTSSNQWQAGFDQLAASVKTNL